MKKFIASIIAVCLITSSLFTIISYAEQKDSSVTLTVEGSEKPTPPGGGSTPVKPTTPPAVDLPGNESGGVDSNGKPIRTKEHIKVNRKYADNGYIQGYPDKSVKPSGKITREEYVVMLDNIFTFKENKKPIKFTDVQSNRWSKKGIDSLSSQGLIKGVGKNKFEPSRNVTREEVILILAATLEVAEYPTKSELKDIAGLLAEKDIARLYNMGVISNETKYFRGKENATRAEVIDILNRVIYESNKSTKKVYYIDLPVKHKFYQVIRKASKV